VAFSPDDLFKAGEKGCWYDPSDLTTLFQDSNGTIPVTGPDVLIGKMLDKSGNGNHITATTGKPTLRRDSNGNYYLQGNGTSTAMSTPATVDLSTTNKITIFSGAAAANVGTGIICEATAAWVGSPGTYAMYVGDAYPATVAVGDAAFSNQLIGSSPGPIADQSRHVYSGLHTIPGDSSTLRTDGVSFPPGTADKGAGNFGNYTMNFMARNNGEALWLNGGVYAFILRGTESTGFEIRSTEQWIANKTGVVLA
jgi:hypothetical protein